MDDDDDVVCITSMGQSIRIPVSSISIQKAYASGVCITKLKDSDSIVAIARTDAEKLDEIDAGIDEEPEETQEVTED